MSNATEAKIKLECTRSPIIVLIRPQLGENIGAVARAMLNFKCSELRIVSPRDGWPNKQANSVSSGAGRILDMAKIYNSTESACSDLHYLFATTVRKRGLTKEIFSPCEAMVKADKMITEKTRVGILFGPERSGLENDEIAQSRSIISVPVSQEFSSINLAQCVVIILYEWFKLMPREEKLVSPRIKTKLATLGEIEYLKVALNERLENKNYFWPEDKRNSLQQNITNLLGRIPLTKADVKTLHGIFTTLAKKIK